MGEEHQYFIQLKIEEGHHNSGYLSGLEERLKSFGLKKSPHGIAVCNPGQYSMPNPEGFEMARVYLTKEQAESLRGLEFVEDVIDLDELGGMMETPPVEIGLPPEN